MKNSSRDSEPDGDPERHQADRTRMVRLTAQVVSCYVMSNHVLPSDVVGLIESVCTALASVSGDKTRKPTQGKPAVPINKSVADTYLICLEDGKKLTMLKRYLRSHHNLSVADYRAKWGLPFDYPMVAPAYARLRSAFAKKIGLGRAPIPRKGRKRSKVGN